MRTGFRLRTRNLPAAICVGWGLVVAPITAAADQPAKFSHAPARPPLGKIFFSPAERHARRGASSGASQSETGVAPSERFSVNGAVNSSVKGRAVWINEVAIEDSAAKKAAWTDREGNVWFHSDELGTRLIRPGQTIDRHGTIKDLLPAGSVTEH